MNVTITTTAETLKLLQECLRVTKDDYDGFTRPDLPDYAKRILLARVLLDFRNSNVDSVITEPFSLPPPTYEC